MRRLSPLILALTLWQPSVSHADEATIRQRLSERLPNLPRIEDVRKTPMPGLYEVRINQSELLYTDANGDFILQGQLIDTKAKSNLTEERMNALSAIDFSQLPLKDALVTVRGKGERKLAVFSDPNCGFCKRLERDLVKVDNLTVYTFLLGMLGPDSQTKAKQIWCAKDRSAAYVNWMTKAVAPSGEGDCDTAALERNMAFAQRNRISGTPTSFLPSGQRVVGADIETLTRGLSR